MLRTCSLRRSWSEQPHSTEGLPSLSPRMNRPCTPGLLHCLIAGLVGHRLGGDHFRRLSFKPEPINWPYEVIVGDARLRAGVNKLRGRQGRTVSSNPLLLRQIGIEGTVHGV